MTDGILDILVKAARRCDRAVNRWSRPEISDPVKRLDDVAERVGESWSGCVLTRDLCVYREGYRRPLPGEYYSNMGSRGPWVEVDPDALHEDIRAIAEVTEGQFCEIEGAAETCRDAFSKAREAVLPALEAALATHPDDAVLRRTRDEIGGMKGRLSQQDFAEYLLGPVHQQVTWGDIRAGNTRLGIPPHVCFRAYLLQLGSCSQQAARLAAAVRGAAEYLRLRQQMKGNTVAKLDGKIFIGHGRSPAWRELKDFLCDRLGLDYDEFNRESAAGRPTAQRLEEMLDGACFAFIVMTAEDRHADGSAHARENVIHEAGLFQGRLGFGRAIILLEDGCEEFGNIHGLTQIRFPKGDFRAVKDEVRQVLEREGIVSGT